MKAPVSLDARWAFLGRDVPMRLIAKMPVSWFAGPMIATPAARARLRDWARAGCPDVDAAEVAYAGDTAMRPIVVERLRQLPAPVRWYVLSMALFIGIGRSALGQIEGRPILDAHIRSVITISGAYGDLETDATVGHETAHAWLETGPQAPRDPRAPAVSVEDLAWLAERVKQSPRVREYAGRAHALSEIQAARLAQHWGCVGLSADPLRARRMARRTARSMFVKETHS